MAGAKEKTFEIVFLIAASAAVIAVALISLFLFAGGVPAIVKIGAGRFLGGTVWKPGSGLYGILPFIAGSLCVTAGALFIGAPLGILTAVYLARFCPGKFVSTLRQLVSLLAGIPSVVYGFFALVLIAPAVGALAGGTGKSLFTASLILGLMITPTIAGVAGAALEAVPGAIYEGALALGASHEEAVFFTVLPAAKQGVAAGIILGLGRAVGETMAVIMVAGNQPVLPSGVFRGLRTLTANIALEMGYAADLHREALIACGVVLFCGILAINLVFSILKGKK